MKRIGILTFNRAMNYGAVLQAYALKKVCENLGYETHIVDYNTGADSGPQPIEAFLQSPNKKRASLRLAKNSLSYLWDRKKWKKFKAFRKQYLDESHACENSRQVSDLGYDAYVMGSDQIWNYHITGGRFDPVYFGRLSDNLPAVVYGASAHDTPFPLNMELQFEKILSETRVPISIREQTLSDYAGKLTGIRYPVVADPVLLAGKDILKEIESGQIPSERYILIYQIDKNPASDISIRTLRKRFGLKVNSMTVPKIGSSSGKKGASGPEQFLALLDHAEFIVTNSFHGVAISLLFHKQFYVYENGGVMTRIDSLLDSLSLGNRKVKMVGDIDTDEKIDYSDVDRKLSEMREHSLQFLKKALLGEMPLQPYEEEPAKPVEEFRKREKKDCSGCMACLEICPVNAIKMETDREGFFYPAIDENKCIRCKKCDHFCSFNTVRRSGKEDLPEAYGVKHRVLNTRMTSRSGGAFIAVSDVILRNDGIVYGAVLDEKGRVRHKRAVTKKERDAMKGAKYVQSDMTGIFKLVIQDLKADRKVLFSGTPCQVAGLKALLASLGISDANLLTCDLVCHGAPSPGIWQDYRNYIEKKYKAGIVKAEFRDKSFGWESHYESFVLDNGRKIVSRDYTDLFYDHIMFRPSCHNCHYASVNRTGDITLADFWGIENNDPSFADEKGISLVLINTPKGKEVFMEASGDMEVIKCDIQNCLQPTLIRPSRPSSRREQFWKSYEDKGFSRTLHDFVKPLSTGRRLKRDIKQILYQLKLRPHP